MLLPVTSYLALSGANLCLSQSLAAAHWRGGKTMIALF
jgi:hypothetical protein